MISRDNLLNAVLTRDNFFVRSQLTGALFVPIATRSESSLVQSSTFSTNNNVERPDVSDFGSGKLVTVRLEPSVLEVRGRLVRRAGADMSFPNRDFRWVNFCSEQQLWFRPNLDGYRDAAMRLWPALNWDELHADHVLSRAVAYELGYEWIRICPTTQPANNSGGAWEKRQRSHAAAQYQGVQPKAHTSLPTDPIMRGDSWMSPYERSLTCIAYARHVELAKMLGWKPGPDRYPTGILNLVYELNSL